MNKRELIEKIKKMDSYMFNFRPHINETQVLNYIRQLDEPQKVTVPQFVADWIEKGKKELSLRDLMSSSYTSTEVGNWLGELDEDGGFKNQETFARAVLDGYTVEKEKRYLVTMKGKIEENVLTYGNNIFRYFFTQESTSKAVRIYHTRKELEEADFGWVFDCPGVEVKEMKE